MNWKINLQLSHSKMADTKTQSALVEFLLADKDKKSTEQLLVEFTKDELMDFHKKVSEIKMSLFIFACRATRAIMLLIYDLLFFQLEEMQAQLDSLF